MFPFVIKYSSSGVAESINDRTRQIKKIKDELNKLKVNDLLVS